MTRLTLRPFSSARQAGMPDFVRASRISLRAIKLDPTFAAAALFIFGGTTAAPSSLAAAFDNTINCVSLSFAIFSSFTCDGICRHQRDPAKARKAGGVGKKGASIARLPTKQSSASRRSPVNRGGQSLRCAEEHQENYHRFKSALLAPPLGAAVAQGIGVFLDAPAD